VALSTVAVALEGASTAEILENLGLLILLEQHREENGSLKVEAFNLFSPFLSCLCRHASRRFVTAAAQAEGQRTQEQESCEDHTWLRYGDDLST